MRLPRLVSYLLYNIAQWPFPETVGMHPELNYCLVEFGYKCRNMDMPLAGKNLYVDYTEFIVFTLTWLFRIIPPIFQQECIPKKSQRSCFLKRFI